MKTGYISLLVYRPSRLVRTDLWVWIMIKGYKSLSIYRPPRLGQDQSSSLNHEKGFHEFINLPTSKIRLGPISKFESWISVVCLLAYRLSKFIYNRSSEIKSCIRVLCLVVYWLLILNYDWSLRFSYEKGYIVLAYRLPRLYYEKGL